MQCIMAVAGFLMFELPSTDMRLKKKSHFYSIRIVGGSGMEVIGCTLTQVHRHPFSCFWDQNGIRQHFDNVKNLRWQSHFKSCNPHLPMNQWKVSGKGHTDQVPLALNPKRRKVSIFDKIQQSRHKNLFFEIFPCT